MNKEFKVSLTFRVLASVVAAAGLTMLVIGLFRTPDRAWANYLLNNYYFLSLSLGAAFFLTIQYITQSGWASGFNRISESMMAYIPFAAIFFLLLFFGMHNLYHWSHEGAIEGDVLLQHKSPYLNTPFFYIRTIIYFGLWISLTMALRNFSLKEDVAGGLEYFKKSHKYSKILLFVFAITLLFSSIDWIMSLSPHWYSTVFAFKSIVSAFLHGVSIMVLVVLLLHRKGYFSFMNKFHLHDFSRYIFMLAILWGYLWFVQFMIIWYANIPEETVYYYSRWQEGWKILFFSEIILNWGLPFMILLPVAASRSKIAIWIVIILLIVGQYVEQYLQIMPQVTGKLQFGLLEIGSFLGYAGLFALIVSISLGKARIIPINHPYLGESLEHHF